MNINQSSRQEFTFTGTGAHRYWAIGYLGSAPEHTNAEVIIYGELSLNANRVGVDYHGYVDVSFEDQGQLVNWDLSSIITYDQSGSPHSLSSGMFEVQVSTENSDFSDAVDITTLVTNPAITARVINMRVWIKGLAEANYLSGIDISIDGSRWAYAPNAARAYAMALESGVENRNPATWYTYQHPDMLTQTQFSTLFFGTDKFAPFVGVRSINGGAPEFTNIWCQFSAFLTDIKLGTGSVKIAHNIGSTNVQLTNISGSTIDGPVDAYILG
jgi:hypothetical protein